MYYRINWKCSESGLKTFHISCKDKRIGRKMNYRRTGPAIGNIQTTQWNTIREPQSVYGRHNLRKFVRNLKLYTIGRTDV